MKFVLNKCFGGFGLSDWAEEQMGCRFPSRTNSNFIALVENYPNKVSDWGAELKVVEIPDNATDYEINDYDGHESIIYVVDGKLYHA